MSTLWTSHNLSVFPPKFLVFVPSTPFSSVAALVHVQCLSDLHCPSRLGWAVYLCFLPLLTAPPSAFLCAVLYTEMRFLAFVYCCGSPHLSTTTRFICLSIEPQARLFPAGLSMHESPKHIPGFMWPVPPTISWICETGTHSAAQADVELCRPSWPQPCQVSYLSLPSAGSQA